MKTNAIVRIVIWSLVIVLLAWILMAGINLGGILRYFRSDDVPAESIAPRRLEEGGQLAGPDGVHLEADAVREISIDWVSGNITICPWDGQQLHIFETGDTAKHPLTWKVKDGKLSIDYSDTTIVVGFGVDLGEKDLTIQVPKDWHCQELEVDMASSMLDVRDLTLWDVDIDGASGQCRFDNCTVDTLDIDTASGDVSFTGCLEVLDMDGASASFTGLLANVPSRMEMDTMSGGLDVALPEDAGFTLNMSGMNCDFTTDFAMTGCGSSHSSHHSHSADSCKRGTHVHGNGKCRIDMDAMSGDVCIRKAS